MTIADRTQPDITTRRAPGLGGFNLTLLGLEIRRLLRNRRTLVFSIVLPAVFFLIFGQNNAYSGQSAGNGNVSAFVMISMALYGAVLATTTGYNKAGWRGSSKPSSSTSRCSFHQPVQ